MRILVAHNQYLEPGGEDVVVSSEVELLRSLGHDVELLETSNARVAQLGQVRTGLRSWWSRESYRVVRDRLAEGRHDLLHVHNWFPLLSPSMHWAARGSGVPVVQTLHNHRLACLCATLTREGRRCTDCVGRLPWPGVLHACYRESRLASLALAGALTFHRSIGTWDRAATAFIVLSQYSLGALQDSGVPLERCFLRRNFVHPDPGPGPDERSFALFAGRLAVSKGVRELLAAWPEVGMPLLVAGDGPLADEVREVASRRPSVRWLGHLRREELLERMGQAAFLVATSRSSETCPMVVIEAFSRGTPVIACDQGAVEELVADGESGVVVPLGDVGALRTTIQRLAENPAEARRLGRGARRAFEAGFTREVSGQRLLEIYDRAIQFNAVERGGIESTVEA